MAVGFPGLFGPTGSNFGFITVGPSPQAGVGLIRLPGGAQNDITARNNGNTADLTQIATDISDNLFFGTDASFTLAKQYAGVNVYGTSSVALGIQSNTYEFVNGSLGTVEFWKPITGSALANVPLQFPSASFAIAGAAVTLTAAQYKNLFLIATGAPGADRTVIAPTVNNGTWFFQNNSNNAQTFKTAAGTGISVATTKGAWLQCDGTNIIRISNDI
jgi:hypothetical protein